MTHQHHRLHAQLGAVAHENVNNIVVVVLLTDDAVTRQVREQMIDYATRSNGGFAHHIVHRLQAGLPVTITSNQLSRLHTWHASSRGLRPAVSHLEGSAPRNRSARTTSWDCVCCVCVHVCLRACRVSRPMCRTRRDQRPGTAGQAQIVNVV